MPMSMHVDDEVDVEGSEPPPRRRPGPRPWPIGRARTIALIVALCFLAGAVGWWIGDPGKPSFNDADVGFLDDMSRHHSGAIQLGFDYFEPTNDAVLAQFAREIITNQSQEIAIMNGLAGEAGHRASMDDDIAMEWMGPPFPVDQMPGMPTPTQLDELQAATGRVADDQFSELMIRHHAAGIDMAKAEVARGSNPTVKELAQAMADVQRTEILEMNHRREKLGLPAVDVPT
jgi:uncharacterized protein (DUF305 family)